MTTFHSNFFHQYFYELLRMVLFEYTNEVAFIPESSFQVFSSNLSLKDPENVGSGQNI